MNYEQIQSLSNKEIYINIDAIKFIVKTDNDEYRIYFGDNFYAVVNRDNLPQSIKENVEI